MKLEIIQEIIKILNILLNAYNQFTSIQFSKFPTSLNLVDFNYELYIWNRTYNKQNKFWCKLKFAQTLLVQTRFSNQWAKTQNDAEAETAIEYMLRHHLKWDEVILRLLLGPTTVGFKGLPGIV